MATAQKKWSKRIGRPPLSQLATLRILKEHPDLKNRPREIASFMRRYVGFEEISGKAVSAALSKIRTRFGGILDIDSICIQCLGRIVTANPSERVCERCGTVYEYVESSSDHSNSEPFNALWSVYDSKKLVAPLGSRRISNETARIQEFGQGKGSRLIERSLSALAEIMKSHPELNQQVTDLIAKLVIEKCEVRSKGLSRVCEADAKDCIILAFLDFGRRMPQLNSKMLQLIHEMCMFFPDVASRAPKSTKSPKLSSIDLRELD